MSSLTIDDVATLLNQTREDLSQTENNHSALQGQVNSLNENTQYQMLKLTGVEAKQIRHSNDITSLFTTTANVSATNAALNSTITFGILPGFQVLEAQVAQSAIYVDETVQYTRSEIPAIQTQVNGMAEELTQVSQREAENAQEIRASLADVVSTITLGIASIEENASQIQSVALYASTIQLQTNTHSDSIQNIINQFQTLNERDTVIYAQVATLSQQSVANTEALDALTQVDGAVYNLWETSTINAGLISTLQTETQTHDARVSTLETISVPQLEEQISNLRTYTETLKTGTDFALYPAVQGLNMAGYEIENVSSISIANVGSVGPTPGGLLQIVKNGEASAPSGFSDVQPQAVGVYTPEGVQLASDDMTIGAPFSKGAWYCVVHTAPVAAVRLWDPVRNAYLSGVPDMATIALDAFQVADENNVVHSVQLYAAAFKWPERWTLWPDVAENFRLGVFENFVNASQAGLADRTFYGRFSVVHENLRKYELLTDKTYRVVPEVVEYNNDSLLVLQQGTGVFTSVNLPKFDPSSLQSQITSNTAGLASVSSAVQAMENHEERIVGLETRLPIVDQLATDVESVTATVATHTENLVGLYAKNAQVDTSIESLNISAATQATALSALTGRVGTTEGNISALSQSLTATAANVAAITSQGAITQYSTLPMVSDMDAAGYKISSIKQAVFTGITGNSPNQIVIPELTSAYQFQLGLGGDAEKSLRMTRTNQSTFTTGYLLDTANNPAEVRPSNPGQLQLRAYVPGGAGITYIGAANNYAPRTSLAGTMTPAAFTPATGWAVVFSSVSQNNAFASFGYYLFRFMLQTQSVTTGVGSPDYTSVLPVQYAWEWSADNATWTGFSSGSSHALMNGITTVDYTSAESTGSGTTPSTTSNGVIYFRLKVKAPVTSAYYMAVVGNPLILQIR